MPVTISSSQSGASVALGAHEAEHVGHVAGVEEAGVGRHARGRVGHAHDVHAVVSTTSPASVSSQLPPWSAAMSTTTAPAAMPSTIAVVTSTGRLAPRHGGRGDDDVGAAHLRGQGGTLAPELLGLSSRA